MRLGVDPLGQPLADRGLVLDDPVRIDVANAGCAAQLVGQGDQVGREVVGGGRRGFGLARALVRDATIIFFY